MPMYVCDRLRKCQTKKIDEIKKDNKTKHSIIKILVC